VAYGTDPERVLDIMENLAAEHHKVKKRPMPKAYFLGFGDSSLDFRLLAWTHIDNRLSVESELKTELNKQIVKAGIEIPFPQRDLHIRSDATRADPADEPKTEKKPADSKTKEPDTEENKAAGTKENKAAGSTKKASEGPPKKPSGKG
jgi:small-conductance mechanosensitive channel